MQSVFHIGLACFCVFLGDSDEDLIGLLKSTAEAAVEVTDPVAAKTVVCAARDRRRSARRGRQRATVIDQMCARLSPFSETLTCLCKSLSDTLRPIEYVGCYSCFVSHMWDERFQLDRSAQVKITHVLLLTCDQRNSSQMLQLRKNENNKKNKLEKEKNQRNQNISFFFREFCFS